jgi:hypothetical protein
MRAGVARQQSGGPQFVRVAEVLALLTGQRHQPSLRRLGDLRSLARSRTVVQRRHHAEPYRSAKAALHGVMGHTDPDADRR